ncbi:hypothetical protein COO60DRAFT_453945 [Scenedesmus sp. NREL 46B-D3]|nr:hypothetical protein COO60DRAFT_453945 [Scenedesmus sp. NREL 46B-D3]
MIRADSWVQFHRHLQQHPSRQRQRPRSPSTRPSAVHNQNGHSMHGTSTAVRHSALPSNTSMMSCMETWAACYCGTTSTHTTTEARPKCAKLSQACIRPPHHTTCDTQQLPSAAPTCNTQQLRPAPCCRLPLRTLLCSTAPKCKSSFITTDPAFRITELPPNYQSRATGPRAKEPTKAHGVHTSARLASTWSSTTGGHGVSFVVGTCQADGLGINCLVGGFTQHELQKASEHICMTLTISTHA